jgi:hypothetical protein
MPKTSAPKERAPKKRPDHHDAELILRLYDLRRESVMRASRAAIMKWIPRTWDDLVAVLAPAHELNAPWRQVSSYFEMAYGFARQGIVNPDFLAENAGEGFFLFAKVRPHLERFRKEHSPLAFRNVEWLIANSKEAQIRFKLVEARVQKMSEAK